MSIMQENYFYDWEISYWMIEWLRLARNPDY